MAFVNTQNEFVEWFVPPMTDGIYIYLLRDPIVGKIRYVGKTTNPVARRRQHRNAHHRTGRYGEWIRSMLDAGAEVTLHVVYATADEMDAWLEERYLIAMCLTRGDDLTNVKCLPDEYYKPRKSQRQA